MVETHVRPAIRAILGLDNVETVVRPAIQAARFECDWNHSSSRHKWFLQKGNPSDVPPKNR